MNLFFIFMIRVRLKSGPRKYCIILYLRENIGSDRMKRQRKKEKKNSRRYSLLVIFPYLIYYII